MSRQYSAAAKGWESLLGLSSAGTEWGWWLERFAFLTTFLAWADRLGPDSHSEYAIGVELRDLFEGHQAAFTLGRPAHPQNWKRGEDAVARFVTEVGDLLSWLRNRA